MRLFDLAMHFLRLAVHRLGLVAHRLDELARPSDRAVDIGIAAAGHGRSPPVAMTGKTMNLLPCSSPSFSPPKAGNRDIFPTIPPARDVV
jgi:hypothetical protein